MLCRIHGFLHGASQRPNRDHHRVHSFHRDRPDRAPLRREPIQHSARARVCALAAAAAGVYLRQRWPNARAARMRA